MTVRNAGGGTCDGDRAIFCSVEASITTVIDGNRNGWRGGVDNECAVAGEGIAAVNGGEFECGVVACGVFDGAAVERERGGGLVVEIGSGVACLDGVGEGEGVGARARGIVDGSI